MYSHWCFGCEEHRGLFSSGHATVIKDKAFNLTEAQRAHLQTLIRLKNELKALLWIALITFIVLSIIFM